jgi:hypothetical protein
MREIQSPKEHSLLFCPRHVVAMQLSLIFSEKKKSQIVRNVAQIVSRQNISVMWEIWQSQGTRYKLQDNIRGRSVCE